MHITSYLSRGILSITFDAETNETSCSFETPPNKTATLILAIMITPLIMIRKMKSDII
jgi:hypothetical protein